MDKFYIIANSEKDEGLKVSERVAKYLESKGKAVPFVRQALEIEIPLLIIRISVPYRMMWNV